MTKKSEEAAIEEILQNFKFELVYAYMKMTGWTYFGSPDTPSISTLEEKTRDLLETVGKKPGNYSRCGGFEASCINEGQAGMALSLKFTPLETVAYL